jgi:hypothetical protein
MASADTKRVEVMYGSETEVEAVLHQREVGVTVEREAASQWVNCAESEFKARIASPIMLSPWR